MNYGFSDGGFGLGAVDVSTPAATKLRRIQEQAAIEAAFQKEKEKIYSDYKAARAPLESLISREQALYWPEDPVAEGVRIGRIQNATDAANKLDRDFQDKIASMDADFTRQQAIRQATWEAEDESAAREAQTQIEKQAQEAQARAQAEAQTAQAAQAALPAQATAQPQPIPTAAPIAQPAPAPQVIREIIRTPETPASGFDMKTLMPYLPYIAGGVVALVLLPKLLGGQKVVMANPRRKRSRR